MQIYSEEYELPAEIITLGKNKYEVRFQYNGSLRQLDFYFYLDANTVKWLESVALMQLESCIENEQKDEIFSNFFGGDEK